METQPKSLKPAFVRSAAHWLFCGPKWRLSAIVVYLVTISVYLAYQEENWRGRRAWAHSQQTAAARGLVTNWNAFCPPRVPEDSNFFAAPRMQEWFVGRGSTGLSQRLGYQNFRSSLHESNYVVAQVTVVPPETLVAPGAADVVLRFDDPLLTISTAPEPAVAGSKEVIPLIVMDEVPLTAAIKACADQAKIKYVLDRKINYERSDPYEDLKPEPLVSLRWTNLTAVDALKAILANYNFELIPNPKTGIARITIKDLAGPDVCVDRALTAQLGQLICNAAETATNDVAGAHLTAALGFELSAKPLGAPKPAHIVVRADKVPTGSQVTDFFPKHPLGNSMAIQIEVHARSAGSDSFEVYLHPAPRVAAADYLAWSDQFDDDLNLIREALKRPYARMDGDYSDPVGIPIPNFVTVRTVAQFLSQRAQAHLLLGQPDKALEDLMLVRDMCRLLEGRPTQRPMTLVAAMIETAVTGLYVQVVGDGTRMRAWNDAQLAALEEQLKAVDLPPLVGAALDCERVSAGHVIEKMTAENYDRMISGSSQAKDPWQKLKDPMFCYLAFGPRGWVYQNMVVIDRLHQPGWGYQSVTNGLISPRRANETMQAVEKTFDRPLSAYTGLAAVVLPNFVRATQTTARNQTLANEARVVCALERHRLACGSYPETLDALVPRFIDKLPVDIIGGKPLKYKRDGERFTLYSIGWNERDDGGVSAMKSDGTGDLTKADWIWPYGEVAKN